jgi:hypothetical protein
MTQNMAVVPDAPPAGVLIQAGTRRIASLDVSR